MKKITCNIYLSEDRIKEGDLFFFKQYSGTPTIRRAKGITDGEDWSAFKNGKTGERSYHKIDRIEDLLISIPK